MNNELQLAVDKAKIAIMRDDQVVFFTLVLLQLNQKFTEAIETAAVDGVNIHINPTFFMGLTHEEQVFLYLHEVMHITLRHITRRGQRDPQLWNIAADYVINWYLQENGYRLIKGALVDSRFNGMPTDQVYKILLEENNSPCPQPDKDGALPGDIQSPGELSEDGQNKQDVSEAGIQKLADQISQSIDEILVQAAIQAEASKDDIGNIPQELRIYLQKLRSTRIPWEQVLRRYITKTVKGKRNFNKPNRRYFPKIYLPTRSEKVIEKLLVAVDISGSVSHYQFEIFIAEVARMIKTLKPKGIDVLQFDTGIKSITEVSDVRELYEVQFRGRGGTNIDELVNYVGNHKGNYHAVITITDGRFRMVDRQGKTPWIWLINDNPDRDMDWGKVIHFSTEAGT